MTRTLPRLHIVTDDEVLRAEGFQRTAADLLSAGGERIALHLRGRAVGGRRLWEMASACAEVARTSGSVILINDRLDIAVACDAAGVQLGGESFVINDARSVVGTHRWIGASIHSSGEAIRAQEDGADFVVAGTLYETPSHPGRRATGISWLSSQEPLRIPMLGIGGITPARVRKVRDAGAYGVAVIRGIWMAPSPVEAMESYLTELE